MDQFTNTEKVQQWGAPVSAVIAYLYMEIFEEKAMESAPCKPNIWKHYVDDTFTILDRDRIDSFLQHLTSQQPTIHFTMETKNDSKITFLNTSVLFLFFIWFICHTQVTMINKLQ